MAKVRNIAVVTGLFLMLIGCIERREYPIEPVIAYKSFAVIQNSAGYDSIGYLTFEFTDGDGDIGLSQSDTFAPYNPGSEYYYNFFITLYQKNGAVFQPLSEPYNSRIPNINPDGIDQDLKGEIQIEIDMTIWPLVLTSDTIKMTAYIVDRALHKSNTIETPVFAVDLP